MITPSAFHQLRFCERDKEALILVSNRLMIGGLISLAAALTCSVFLVTDFIYGGVAAAFATVGAAVVFVGLWLILPLARELRDRAG